jgi:hypothetical protein
MDSQVFIPSGHSVASAQNFEQTPGPVASPAFRRHWACWHSEAALQTALGPGAIPKGLLHSLPAPASFTRQTSPEPQSLSYVQPFVQMLPYVAHSPDSQSPACVHASANAFFSGLLFSKSQPPAPAEKTPRIDARNSTAPARLTCRLLLIRSQAFLPRRPNFPVCFSFALVAQGRRGGDLRR